MVKVGPGAAFKLKERRKKEFWGIQLLQPSVWKECDGAFVIGFFRPVRTGPRDVYLASLTWEVRD